MSSKKRTPSKSAKAARASQAARTAAAAKSAKPAKSNKPAPAPAPDDSAVSGPRPTRIAAAAALAAAEGVVLAGFGVYVLVMGLVGDPDSPEQAEMLGITVLALAVLPLVAARGLWLRRRWSRGPAMITQLMALPVAWTLIQNGGGLIAAGAVIGLVALAVLALLVNPTATEALGIGPRDA